MVQTITKAGTVTFRRGADGGVEVLIITRKLRPNVTEQWILPLGTVDPGETPVVAAVRETREEAGYRAKAGPIVGELAWTDDKGRPQRCQFFAATFDGETKWDEQGQRKREWLSIAAAAERVVDAFRPFILDGEAHLDELSL